MANLVLNPDFEVDASSWAAAGAAVLSRTTVEFHGGVASLLADFTATSQGAYQDVGGLLGTQTYNYNVWCKAPSSKAMQLVVDEYTVGFGTYIGGQTLGFTGTGAWQLMEATRTLAPTGALLQIILRTNSAGSGTFYMDDASLERIVPSVSYQPFVPMEVMSRA